MSVSNFLRLVGFVMAVIFDIVVSFISSVSDMHFLNAVIKCKLEASARVNPAKDYKKPQRKQVQVK